MRYDVETQYRDASNLNARINLHSRFSTHPVGWMRWVFDEMHFEPGERILEVGAGPGTLWQKNLDRMPPGCEVTLTDFSAGMVAQARDNLQGCHADISIRRANAEDLPFEDAGFDVVLANHMLYHVPDISKALGEFRRVLKPGGRVFAATNGCNHMKEIADLVRRFDPQIPYRAVDLTARFGLENGAEQMTRFFGNVSLHLFEDHLVVTEPEPLVAYVMSMMTVRAELAGERQEEFRRFVRDEFATKGPIIIQQATGLFEGTRAESA